MCNTDDYDDNPGRQRSLPPWLIIVIALLAVSLLIPAALVVLFILAFGFSNM